MKTDFKRELSAYTAVRGTFSIVQVPPLGFLMIDGEGDPNTAPAYADALASLYPLAYRVKFLSKNELDRDYAVMPLEALWWSDDMAAFTTARDKSRWSWTLMIMVPDWITDEQVETARTALAKKRTAPRLADVSFARFEEGLCVQTLHVGSYDDEAPVLQEMHEEFLPANSLTLTGKHHEIYLSDARRTPTSKLKTILRQPVARVPDQPSLRTASERGRSG